MTTKPRAARQPRGAVGTWSSACPSPQSSKVLAKRELLCVPVIGWTWYFLEIVFCRRRWEEDRDTVVRGLQRLADYPEHMWVSESPAHGRTRGADDPEPTWVGESPAHGRMRGSRPRPARSEPRPCASPQFLLYCEGTRFTEKKHRVSMEVAASKGLPVLKYHLLPRTKGFTTAVQCLRGTGEGPAAAPRGPRDGSGQEPRA